MYKTIVEAVLRHGEEIPEKTAIAFKETQISYGELGLQVKKAARLLKTNYHVQERDSIMLSAVSKPEYVVVLLAIQYLGAVSVPIDKSALEENICDIYFFNGTKLLLTDTKITDDKVRHISLRAFYQEVLEVRSDEQHRMIESEQDKTYIIPEEGLVAEMLFTTGTTGRPKGAMLSYKNIYASTHNTWEGVGMEETDRILIPLPLNHSVGMRVLRTALCIGATVVIQNGFAFPKELKKNLEQYACTGFVCVPAVLERLYRQMGAEFIPTLSGLRYMEIGAGSLSYDMKKKLREMLPSTKIINTWGSTETGGAIFLNVSKYPDKLTSLGKPVKTIRLKVVDPDGKTVNAVDIETAGRMALQGDMQMMGYYGLREATEDALRDGWLFTNDLVYTDSDGFVYMLGRADDIINVGGEKVSPVEVENLSSLHPEIRECACIGAEDPEGILGQVPVLYYVPEEGKNPDEKEMLRFFSSKMESYKVPKIFVKLNELPRNRMKKLDRRKLRELWKENGREDLTNPVIEALLNRQSIRNFTEKEITRPVLEQLFSCAIAAPSANNMQTWRFTVIQNKEKILDLKNRITDTITGMQGKKVKFYGFNNPAAVVLITNDRRNENGILDAALAAENLMLAAHSMGIGSVWNNALKNLSDEPMIREYLEHIGVAARHQVCAMILLGYPEEKSKKPERRRDVINWV